MHTKSKIKHYNINIIRILGVFIEPYLSFESYENRKGKLNKTEVQAHENQLI
jgi:hypothetical protein